MHIKSGTIQTPIMANVLSEYLKIFSEYSEKYGEKIAVLMQVGHFMEIMGIENEEEKIGNASELSRVLNIILTRKNKKIIRCSMHNPLMLGFPCLALNKYLPVLLNEDYTVVIVEQRKAGAGFRRTVANVISPSTYIDSSEDDNYLVHVHVDRHKHVGMSAISVVTGNSVVHECCSRPDDADLPFDDAMCFVKQYRPREVVLSGAMSSGLKSHLELDDVLCHEVKAGKDSHTVAYQNAVLGCAFDNNSVLSNIEYLDLERTPHALLSYVLLIEFVNEHDPMLLRRLSKPELHVDGGRLVLSTSSLDQLNVTSTTKSKHTLYNVVDACITKAGKRLLLRKLASPSADPVELRAAYDRVDEFGKLFTSENIDRLFKRTADVERLQRRLTVGVMTPPELANLVASYRLVSYLNDAVISTGAVHLKRLDENHRATMSEFVETCTHAFDMEAMPACDCDGAPFRQGVFPALDRLRETVERQGQAMRDLLDKVLTYGVDGARVEHVPGQGPCVVASSLRAKKIPDSAGVIVKHNKAVARITSPETDASSVKAQALEEELKTRTNKLYKKTLEFLSSFSGSFKPIADFLAETDVVRSNFRVKELYNYCRPNVELAPGPSFVDAKGLRHAIVERIDDGVEYVPNDVSLGREHCGMVLYSMNSCGKTTLLRALGLAVVLAQAGCYVPASNFSFRPFRCLMTRILSRDNIMKGQSSFVAEMSELRAVLKRATDPSTLVLADEITHGTEHTSGSAIFVSAVETLADRRVNFMLTTHLHNAYPFFRDLPSVRTCHLSVGFTPGRIQFERKLKEGPGGSVYGLEVCEHLNMDSKFLARAFKIREMITPEKTEERSKIIKVSKYNRNKIIKKCESCGYSPRLPTDQPLHTHHVRERHLADENGMIDGVHVDSVSNLAVLCEQCHRRAHAN